MRYSLRRALSLDSFDSGTRQTLVYRSNLIYPVPSGEWLVGAADDAPDTVYLRAGIFRTEDRFDGADFHS
jgi:hypothetical protein